MKEISLIKKAQELGLCKISKHPITKQRIILPPEPDYPDLADEWKHLQTYANNRRNINIKLQVFKEEGYQEAISDVRGVIGRSRDTGYSGSAGISTVRYNLNSFLEKRKKTLNTSDTEKVEKQ